MEITGVCMFFACLVGLSSQFEYKAAVVEYSPYLQTEKNLRKYVDIIDYAIKRYGFDIMVFPEESLSINVTDVSLVPHPDEKVVPYRNETYAGYAPIRVMSEAAARNKMYLVVNLFERFECANGTCDCPDRGYFLYNTNVAFDRNGTVVARYRKWNLFHKNVDKPNVAELSTFTTDFNVTFGMFICFDILFKSPPIDLVKRNVKHMIFSTYWFGELPFLTAVQMQAGWSHANNVTLLASGVNAPAQGSTGSGIYRRGRKNSRMVERDMDIVIAEDFAEVVGGPGHYKGMNLKENPCVRRAAWAELDPAAGVFNRRVCYRDFCCRFDVRYRRSNAANDGNYTYRAVAFNDLRDFGMGEMHGEAYCAVLLCSNGNCATKPRTGNYPAIFDEMTIDADFRTENSFQMPSTLTWTGDGSEVSLLDVLDCESFRFDRRRTDDTDKDNVSIQLTKAGVDKLITFAIYGRVFD